MFFTQIEFLLFIALVLVGLAMARRNGAYKGVLLLASILFYAYWDVRFLVLLLAFTIVNYICGVQIGQSQHRKSWLWAAIVFDVALLGVFKYYNFFAANLTLLLSHWGVQIGTLQWILPLGISFFTFQSISYVTDVYQGKTSAVHSKLDFSLFILYFPKLMVGPIVRATDFLPQLETRPKRSFERTFSGVRQFLFGLFEKLIVADYLALYVDKVFADYAVYSGLTLFLALAAYTLQIYCDFCGYSDMAIGLSRVLGYELCENFNLPYLSGSVTEFWRRWHISLSTWLRDYIYIPLGGNRRGVVRSYWNSFLTMLIGGLWHGANWTFIFWGAWHGGALVVHRLWKKYVSETVRLPYIVAVLITMATVMTGWLFFRAASFSQAFGILRRMATGAPGVKYFEPVSVFLMSSAVILHVVAHYNWHLKWRECRPTVWGFMLLWLLLLTVLVFRPSGFQPFVYNQF